MKLTYPNIKTSEGYIPPAKCRLCYMEAGVTSLSTCALCMCTSHADCLAEFISATGRRNLRAAVARVGAIELPDVMAGISLCTLCRLATVRSVADVDVAWQLATDASRGSAAL